MGKALGKYKCRSCGTTKEIRSHDAMTASQLNEAYASLPDKVICGWRDCEDYAVRFKDLNPLEATDWFPFTAILSLIVSKKFGWFATYGDGRPISVKVTIEGD